MLGFAVLSVVATLGLLAVARRLDGLLERGPRSTALLWLLPLEAVAYWSTTGMEAMAYAAYRLLKHRFAFSPGASTSIPPMDSLFVAQGYDSTLTSTDYQSDGPAALGNYIAQCLIDFGLQDFCAKCTKCARECPVGAIRFGDKTMFNGYEMWKPDVHRCTSYRVTNPRGSARRRQ